MIQIQINLHKISDLYVDLDSHFKQEDGLKKPLGFNFLERNSRRCPPSVVLF